MVVKNNLAKAFHSHSVYALCPACNEYLCMPETATFDHNIVGMVERMGLVFSCQCGTGWELVIVK